MGSFDDPDSEPFIPPASTAASTPQPPPQTLPPRNPAHVAVGELAGRLLLAENFGMLAEIACARLDGEKHDGAAWVREAIEIAAASGHIQDWRYVQGILRRFVRQGASESEIQARLPRSQAPPRRPEPKPPSQLPYVSPRRLAEQEAAQRAAATTVAMATQTLSDMDTQSVS